MRELVHAHVGRTAIVMGGAPSLPAELERCPPDALYLSANDHGAKLLEERYGRRCDFIVALDDIRDRLVRWGAPIVSRYFWADYRILKFQLRDGGHNSAMAAAWLARLMGCAPILVTGVACYSAGGTYWHAPKAMSNGFTATPRQHRARWRTFAQLHPGMYRLVGPGALSEVFVPFDPRESPEPPPPREVLEQQLTGLTCEVLGERLQIRGRTFARGELVELDRDEAHGRAAKKKVRIRRP